MSIPNLPMEEVEVRMLLDKSSLELFINKGQYVMTNQIFPKGAYTILEIKNLGDTSLILNGYSESKINRVWE